MWYIMLFYLFRNPSLSILMKSSIIYPILNRVYPCKWGWPGLPHSNSNLSNSHSPSHSIHGILLLQTKTLALFLHLHLSRLLWSSLLPLALHFNTCPYQHSPPSTHARTISLHLPNERIAGTKRM